MVQRPNFFLRILDSFLSPQQLVSANSRMRGRIAVFGPLIWASLNISVLLFQEFHLLAEVMVIIPYLFIWVTSLFLIKKAFSPELVVASALIINTALSVLAVNFSSATIFFDMFGFLSTVCFACLVITNLKIRTLTVLVLLLGTFFCFLPFSDKVHDQPALLSSSLAESLIFPVGIFLSAQIILYSMVLRIKGIAQSDLDQEIEWQQRRIRLEEASSMTGTMVRLLARPVQDVRQGLGNLRRNHDALVMKRMDAILDQLLLISQSYSWIYRAYGQEGASALLSSVFMRQLEVLLASKVEEMRWDLEIAHRGQSVEIYGPIPSIMLFLFTTAVQILEEPQPLEKRSLAVEFSYSDKSITWTMRWPFHIQEFDKGRPSNLESELPGFNLRKELIQELAQTCKAHVEVGQEQSVNRIQINGSWRRLEQA